MNATAPLPGSGLTAPTLPSPPTSIPWLGLIAVLMGTFISTLNGRLSTFGLADIRGAVGAGFDEGAWITTAQTAAKKGRPLAKATTEATSKTPKADGCRLGPSTY